MKQIPEPIVVKFYPDTEPPAVLMISHWHMSVDEENEVLRKLRKAIEWRLAVSELEK